MLTKSNQQLALPDVAFSSSLQISDSLTSLHRVHLPVTVERLLIDDSVIIRRMVRVSYVATAKG